MDDTRLARKQGVVRRTHPCHKLSAPVLNAEQPWEADGVDRRIYIYGTVLRDPEAGRFCMWYMHASNRVLFATSADGIHWERPNLGLVAFRGSFDNNILPISLHSPSLVFDPECTDPGQRYKMLGSGLGLARSGYAVACSPDGFRWQLYPKNPVLPGADTCTLAGDPAGGRFLAFHKLFLPHRGHKRRLVFLAESPDLQEWTPAVLTLAPDAQDDEQTANEGGICSHFYNLSAFPWGGQWLGLVTHFRQIRELEGRVRGQSPQDGPIDVQLVSSSDGRAWCRCEDRQPVIPNGPHGYDAGCILGVANQPVPVGDEAWVYYTAVTTTHGGRMPEKRVSIARAAWRLDGWASLDAGSGGGAVETAVLAPTDASLQVNADAAGGELYIEVVEEDGRVLPGYSADACLPLRRDSVRHRVAWARQTHLHTARPFRLRFLLRNARLYSYTL